MFCSTVIPTIGRPTLARAVNSVLAQRCTTANFEVIVVNDSGNPLSEAEWQQSPRVKIIHTNRHERSVARNTGAAMAQGNYLHFLDDDDWLLPGAFENLWTLAQMAGDRAWLYGAAQLVDRATRPLVQLQHQLDGNCFVQTMAGEWIPLQTSLVKADCFFAAGGFNPLIAGAEDIDLLRRMMQAGEVGGTTALVACIGMGQASSTTDAARHVNESRWAREKILDEPGVFQRMRTSAHAGKWRGRMARIYLTSTLWNLKRKRLLKATSRASFALLSGLEAGRYAADLAFWQAIFSRYESETFTRGFQADQFPVTA